MDAVTIADLYDQIIEGEDIPKIAYLLRRLPAEKAAHMLPGWPYSILTNLAHADFWQRVWLGRLEGRPKPKFQDDWRIPRLEEYDEIRASFLDNLLHARKIAQKWPVDHHVTNDERALHTLVSLAVHDAYHIGQIKLMSRILDGGAEESEEV